MDFMLADVKSFSVINLKYIQYFYEMYCQEVNRQLVVDDFEELSEYKEK